MSEIEINEEFCFDSNKKLTIQIAHKALKNYSEKLSEALDLEKSIPIILDTNVLLKYYGMSQVEKRKLIEFLNENRDRIFLTPQIEKEFLRNRIKIINNNFFTPLEAIPAEFEKMYKGIKDNFKRFLDNKKNILQNDYPIIWNSLLEKEEKLNEILEDEQILSESLAQEIKTTITNYKHIRLVDNLLEICTNFKITPTLSDEEVKFVKKQYDALYQKYEEVNNAKEKEKEKEKGKKIESNREIIFPGCGDKLNNKEDPYGDFIIFHEILKFMLSKKDGLNEKDVIFLTLEKAKGDWFHTKNLDPIIHYIEKVFLVTGKILFIIHAEKPLKLSFENIHKTNLQESFPEIWLENNLYNFTEDTPLNEIYMGHYRGWTILVSSNPTNREYYSATAVNFLCYTYPNFLEVAAVSPTGTDLIGVGFLQPLTKEEAYIGIKCKIDDILAQII
jgi:predicted nucleic acid-binding protein